MTDPDMDRIRREVSSWTKSALKVSRQEKRVLLGTNTLNDKPIWVSDDQRAIHMHVLGRSGQGKTYLLENMIRSDIDNRRGVCVIDPHGDLYERILKYCVRKRLHRKMVLVDPSDTGWAVGLNYLEHDPNLYDATAHASRVMKGIAKVFGGEQTETMPRLQRWERNALVPLIRTKMTLVELFEFLETQEPEFRHRLMETESNYYLAREWERFDNLRKADRDLFIDSVLNRANKFAINERVRRIFGQQVSTIDFREAMDQRKIILCNLNSGSLPDEEWKMLGVVIIDKLYQAGRSRGNIPEAQRKRMPPFYFYIDEFGELVSEDIAKALQELRKFKISLVLAHQELEQLRQESSKLYSAVMAEPDIKVTFSISREDAEVMAKSLFTGHIRGDRIKRVIKQTKFEPQETTRTVRGRSQGLSASSGTSSGEVTGSTTSDSVAEAYVPEQGVFGGNSLVGVQSTRGSTTTTTATHTQTSSVTESFGETVTEVPFYEYEPFMEVSTIQDYSIEEMVEKFIAWITNQSPRRAQLKIGTRKPIPIVTPLVKDVRVRQADVEAYKEQIYQQYALPVEEVDREIAGRVERFLAQVRQERREEEAELAAVDDTLEDMFE